VSFGEDCLREIIKKKKRVESGKVLVKCADFESNEKALSCLFTRTQTPRRIEKNRMIQQYAGSFCAFDHRGDLLAEGICRIPLTGYYGAGKTYRRQRGENNSSRMVSRAKATFQAGA